MNNLINSLCDTHANIAGKDSGWFPELFWLKNISSEYKDLCTLCAQQE